MSVKRSEISAKLHNALVVKKITKFQHDVYIQLAKIPPGKVTTYKEMARAVNCNSSQAIGQALRKNPFAPEVPCHRVIKSDMTLGGFSGSLASENVDRKKNLLKSEGVDFTEDDQSGQEKVKEDSIWIFEKNL